MKHKSWERMKCFLPGISTGNSKFLTFTGLWLQPQCQLEILECKERLLIHLGQWPQIHELVRWGDHIFNSGWRQSTNNNCSNLGNANCALYH